MIGCLYLRILSKRLFEKNSPDPIFHAGTFKYFKISTAFIEKGELKNVKLFFFYISFVVVSIVLM